MAAKKKSPSPMPKWQPAPPELAELFARSIQPFPEAQPKKMFGYPAAFVGGHLFAGLHQDSLILRLSPDDRAALLEQPASRVFEPMPGRPMREYVVVPPSLVHSADNLHPWLAKALAYAKTLPPKAAKAPRKSKA
jgi:TfoX/Sxy family transcriptional regulator of competence genes